VRRLQKGARKIGGKKKLRVTTIQEPSHSSLCPGWILLIDSQSSRGRFKVFSALSYL
jgi:hypothetical protein